MEGDAFTNVEDVGQAIGRDATVLQRGDFRRQNRNVGRRVRAVVPDQRLIDIHDRRIAGRVIAQGRVQRADVAKGQGDVGRRVGRSHRDFLGRFGRRRDDDFLDLGDDLRDDHFLAFFGNRLGDDARHFDDLRLRLASYQSEGHYQQHCQQ